MCVVRWNAWFGNPPEPEWTADTLNYSFHTFGQDSVPGFEHNGLEWEDLRNPDTLQILVFGDVHNSISHGLWDSVAQRHPYTDCYVQLGDLVERGYFYYNQMLYHELSGTGFDSLPIINVPGNHEYRKGIHRTLPDYWKETFRHPQNGPIGFEGSTYYVDFDRLRLIAINTNGLQHLYEYTRVNTWVKEAIRHADGRFVVVIMHHPVLSSGVGRQNIRIAMTFMKALHNADLVFAGHDHNYARRLPFIDLNSSPKTYLHRLSKRDARVASGLQLYASLKVYSDTLHLQTLLLDSGELYDEVFIVHHENTREILDLAPSTPEVIETPERYKHSDSHKVERFRSRRSARLTPSN